MLVPPSNNSLHYYCQILLAVGLFSLQMLTHIEAYGSKVERTPSWFSRATLPFELETG